MVGLSAVLEPVINMIASGLPLASPGEILLTDHEYGAMHWCWERAAQRLGLTIRTFKQAGCTVTDSQANFIFVDVRRPAKEFREACAQRHVHIGRDFPPLTNWARISMGTLEEMERANEVFRQVLSAPTGTSGA